MYLELAENRVNVGGYTRSAKVRKHTRSYPTLREDENPYIFVPDVENGGGIFIREDKFDAMPEDQFRRFVKAIAPWQPEVQQGVVSEATFLASRSDRKEQRARRKEAKTAKKEAKTKSKEDKNERKNKRAESKASSREKRADAKQTRADKKGGGVDWDKVKDVGGSLISKFTGKGGDEAGADGSGGGAPDDAKPFYKNPIVIVGALALVGGAIYLGTRKKAV